LHREGIYHRDLNLKNIVVRREPDGVKGYIIDLDRAMLFLGEVPMTLARRNLDRLLLGECWTRNGSISPPMIGRASSILS
jgi:tRNA A-37 threonylcarbamoyl transferase component Bud32